MSTPTATNDEANDGVKPTLGANTPLKAVIKSVDMEKPMEEKAIELAQEAMNKFTMEKDMAEYLKREFDRLYSTTWHCVVGKNFGSFVTHGMHIKADSIQVR
ncbi:StAR- lipid transfer protein 13 [Naganishia onofrii]|uniref:StAR- lipid transfer protein 13 n=1 Tax=Naganishia onofrii TaxID=1851511 RepID=A0ACC2XWQ3_9TREE|nr:StAR- lipid transfer protein 13 [Naganishia onofrii]